MGKYTISKIKVSVVKTQSAGADYTDHAKGHWINDRIIANPMSKYKEFQHSRSTWGMDVLIACLATHLFWCAIISSSLVNLLLFLSPLTSVATC